MFGRYSRSRDAQTYVAPLFGEERFPDATFPRSWNVAPKSVQPVISHAGPSAQQWGAVATSPRSKRSLLISCRLDDKNGATWKTMWRTGRVIVPADGWYEFVVEKGKNQPYYVRPLDDRPVFLAAVTSVALEDEPHEDEGYVLVTSSAQTGFVDESSYLPVVLSTPDALRWLNPKTTFGQAVKMLQELITPREQFRWVRVSVGVNNVNNDEPAFNDPLPDEIAV